MENRTYPAVFVPVEEGGYGVTFPDIPEIITQGIDLEDAYAMAQDALGLALTSAAEEGIPLPVASDPAGVVPESGGIVVSVRFNEREYGNVWPHPACAGKCVFQSGSTERSGHDASTSRPF